MPTEDVKRIIDNQIIIDRKINRLINEVASSKEKIDTVLDNQSVIEQYLIDIQKRLEKIERK